MSKKYKHIFFDLDHTLWDFDKNSEIALKIVIKEFAIDVIPDFKFDKFFSQFKAANYQLWDLYSFNKITAEELRNQRFFKAFEGWDFDKMAIIDPFNEAYLTYCPLQGHLIEHTKEVLEYLFDKYQLHVLTNGFEHIQYTKMISSGIFHYFDNVITAKDTNGYLKPDPAFFNTAVKLAKTDNQDCIMIGDTPHVDIKGAIAVGIDSIYFNPQAVVSTVKPTYEINSLKELMILL